MRPDNDKQLERQGAGGGLRCEASNMSSDAAVAAVKESRRGHCSTGAWPPEGSNVESKFSPPSLGYVTRQL